MRAAVRTLTLNVYALQWTPLQQCLADGPAGDYFTMLGSLIAESCQVRGLSIEGRNMTAQQLSRIGPRLTGTIVTETAGTCRVLCCPCAAALSHHHLTGL